MTVWTETGVAPSGVAAESAHANTEQQLQAHARRMRRRCAVLLGLGLAVFLVAIADIMTGPSGLTLAGLIKGILHPEQSDAMSAVIIWNVRLPYAVMAVLVGLALALAGAEMQTILDNPLASPFTLGVSAAAALGASTAIVFRLALPGIPSNLMVTVLAFLFALASVLLLQLVSRARGMRVGKETLVLLGIALVFTCNAVVALLQLLAPEDVLQQLVFWTLGSLARANWEKVAILASLLALVTPFSMAACWRMTVLRLGEDRALSVGINVRRLRFMSLLRISLISAAAVAFVGPIGFIGLVAPHMARMVVGEDQRFFLPASALFGAVLLSLASIASKLLMPGLIVPVGIVTALVGVPAFVALVLKRGRG